MGTDFFVNFNRNLLLFFYKSGTYRLFLRINAFFKNSILKNTDKSLIINSTRKAVSNIRLKDIGVFIFLVVSFNTLLMIFLGKEIDIFSVAARVFFFALGVFLYVRDLRIR